MPAESMKSMVNASMRTVLGLVLTLVAVGADATVLLPSDLGELARDAGIVARGRVVAVEARWTDDRRAVETRVTLEVETYLKGDMGPEVTFRVPGGRLGRYRSLVAGAPEFALDQRVIVLLAHRGPSVPHVVGFSQGVYRVTPSEAGWIVTPPGVGELGRVMRGDASRRPQPLAEFEHRLRVLATQGTPSWQAAATLVRERGSRPRKVGAR